MLRRLALLTNRVSEPMQLHRRGIEIPEQDAYGQSLTGGGAPQGQGSQHQDLLSPYTSQHSHSTTTRRQVNHVHRSSNSFGAVSAGSDSGSIRSSHLQKRTPNGKQLHTTEPSVAIVPAASSNPLDGAAQQEELWAALPAALPGGSSSSRGRKDAGAAVAGAPLQWQSPSHRQGGRQAAYPKKPAPVPERMASFDGSNAFLDSPPAGNWGEQQRPSAGAVPAAFGGGSSPLPPAAQQQQPQEGFPGSTSFLSENGVNSNDAAKAQQGGSWLRTFLSLLSRAAQSEPSGPGTSALPLYQTRFGYPEDDLPLWVELGINTSVMKSKSMAVLNPFCAPLEDVASNNDLAGPIVFAITMASLLLLQGKVEFTAVYVLLVIGAVGFRLLLSLLSGASVPLTFVVSSLGYGLLPSLFLSVLTAAHFWVIGKRMAFTGMPITVAAVAWSSWSASALMTVRMNVQGQRFLILYPVALFYTVFAALVVL